MSLLRVKTVGPIFCVVWTITFVLLPQLLISKENVTPQQNSYSVGTHLTKNFIEKTSEGIYVGFEIELWREIAKRLGLEYKFVEIASFNELLQQLSEEKIDFAIGQITMTRKRSEFFLFTYPYFVSGLSIFTRTKARPNLALILQAIFSPLIWESVVLLFFFVFLFGNIFWLLERRKNSGIANKYFPGIFQAMWCVFSAKSTIGFGDVVPRGWLTRIFVIPIWMLGFLFVSIISAHLVSDFIVKKSGAGITSYFGLSGRTVGTLEGTTAIPVLEALKVKKIVLDPQLAGLYDKLKTGQVEAVVTDYPFIVDFVRRAKREGLHADMVGGKFHEELYSIGISKNLAQQNPELVRKINSVILELQESGFLGLLKQKFFEKKEFSIIDEPSIADSSR